MFEIKKLVLIDVKIYSWRNTGPVENCDRFSRRSIRPDKTSIEFMSGDFDNAVTNKSQMLDGAMVSCLQSTVRSTIRTNRKNVMDKLLEHVGKLLECLGKPLAICQFSNG